MKRLAAACLSASIALAPAAGAGEGDARHGRDLARQHCARCHVIKAYNPYGGAGNTPSFDRLVAWDDGIARIGSFFERPPHPVFTRVEGTEPPQNVPANAATFELSVSDVDDLVAFAEDLKTRTGRDR